MGSQDKRITMVVADDLGDTGMTALFEGLRRGAVADVHVVHVVTDEDLGAAPGGSEMEKQDHLITAIPPRLWERVVEAGREIGDLPEMHVSVHVRLGAPVESILQASADYDADLVVVGTHGRRGVERIILGSVAERLLRHATCPVLIARPKEHESVRKSDRPEPPRAGEDLHSQRPEHPHVYNSTQLVTWTKRDAESLGLKF